MNSALADSGWSLFRRFAAHRGTRLVVLMCALAAMDVFAADEAQLTIPMAMVRSATWEWRGVIQQKLSVGGVDKIAPKRAPELSPLLLRASPDTDVVVLQPFWVNGDRIEAELHGLFLREAKRAKEDAIMRRVGIGAHTVNYGHFGAGVVTVFYIPVFAGFGFSW